MADYIVTSGELTTVANAIREKNGTSSNLSWPNGFVSGISSGSGGGGSSDFSTAEVTVVCNFDPLMLPLPVIFEADLEYPAGLSITLPLFPDTYTVPLYKGRLEVSGDSNWTVNCTGNIEYSDNVFIITGDCTITIS